MILEQLTIKKVELDHVFNQVIEFNLNASPDKDTSRYTDIFHNLSEAYVHLNKCLKGLKNIEVNDAHTS